jgi:starch synthase
MRSKGHPVSAGRVRDTDFRVSIVIGGRFHAFDLAHELQQHGVLGQLITSYPRYKTREFGLADKHVVSVPTVLLQRGLERVAPRFAMRSHNYFNELFAHLARHALERAQADVVHAWSGYALPALRWARSNGRATVLERSSSHILTQVELLEEEYARLGLKWSRGEQRWIDRDLAEYEEADLIAVPSLFAERSFLARGFSAERLLRVPFGASRGAFHPGSKGDETFRVTFAGQIMVRKGVHDLIRAFTEAGIPGSELCLAGNETVEAPFVTREATDRVRLLGQLSQSELADLYRRSSVFAIASMEEGLAMVQAQALRCGLPLVCTTNTGGEDLLRMSGACIAVHHREIAEFPAGYVVPIRRPEAMAWCLRTLSEDADLLRSKRDAALAFARTELDWRVYGRGVIGGYRRVIRSQSLARSEASA